MGCIITPSDGKLWDSAIKKMSYIIGSFGLSCTTEEMTIDKPSESNVRRIV